MHSLLVERERTVVADSNTSFSASYEIPTGLIAFEASMLDRDAEIRARAAKFIGNVSLGATTEVSEPNVEIANAPTFSNLYDAIHKASEGNLEARQMVESNVVTDYLERAYKSGHVTEVEVKKSGANELMQYGQRMVDVYANSIRFIANPVLQERSKIEALNGFRHQNYSDSGLFKEYASVSFSLVTDKLSEDEADKAGFFVETKSLAIQLMTEVDGKTIIQTAFVAGRENRNDADFDKTATELLTSWLGYDTSECDTEELLARPVLIRKDAIPNLVLDVVQKYDEAATLVTGIHKFFGRNTTEKPTGIDYELKRKECDNRQKSVKNDAIAIVSKLIASNPKTPTEAVNNLHILNDALLKRKIVEDDSIEPTVLGRSVVSDVMYARDFYRLGEQYRSQLNTMIARIDKNGTSSSCPGGGKSDLDALSDLLSITDELTETTKEKKELLEDCEFTSRECPKCGAKDVKTICKDGKFIGECGCISD